MSKRKIVSLTIIGGLILLLSVVGVNFRKISFYYGFLKTVEPQSSGQFTLSISDLEFEGQNVALTSLSSLMSSFTLKGDYLADSTKGYRAYRFDIPMLLGSEPMTVINKQQKTYISLDNLSLFNSFKNKSLFNFGLIKGDEVTEYQDKYTLIQTDATESQADLTGKAWPLLKFLLTQSSNAFEKDHDSLKLTLTKEEILSLYSLMTATSKQTEATIIDNFSDLTIRVMLITADSSRTYQIEGSFKEPVNGLKHFKLSYNEEPQAESELTYFVPDSQQLIDVDKIKKDLF